MKKAFVKGISLILVFSLLLSAGIPSVVVSAANTNSVELSKNDFDISISPEEYWYENGKYSLHINITNNTNNDLKGVYIALSAPSTIKFDSLKIETDIGSGETRTLSTDCSYGNPTGWQLIVAAFRNFFFNIISIFSSSGNSKSASCSISGAKIIAKLYWDSADYADNSKTFTKGEWIKLLVEKLKINTNSIDEEWNYFFADTENAVYGKYIEAANAYGILPAATNDGYEDFEQDIPIFNENDLATREFASYTVVKALGFTGGADLDCLDYTSLDYPAEDAVAVAQGIIYLNKNYFLPDEPISEVDCKNLLVSIENVSNSIIIEEEDFGEKIIYSGDVVCDELQNITDYTLTEIGDIYKITIPANSLSISSGDVIILPTTDEYSTGISIKVSSVTKSENLYIIEGSKPEIEEVYSDIYYCGGATIDESSIKPAEGIFCEYDPNGSIDDDTEDYPIDIKTDKSTSVPGTLKFTFANKKITDDVKATGSLSVEIPDISVKIDAHIGWTKTQLNELLISITPKLKVQGTLTFTALESGYELTNDLGNTRWESGRVDLGAPIEFPLGSTGLSVALHFFYNINVKGEGSISYTLVPTFGIQYINGSMRTVKDYTHSLDLLTLKGSAKVGIGMAIDLAALGLMDLIGVDAHAGIGINLSFTMHVCEPTNLYCGDGTIYLYGTLELDPETAFGVFLKKVLKITLSWDFWTENSSPLKLKLHIENLKIVPVCTFGTGGLSGVVKDASTNQVLKNARVKIYSGNSLLKTIYTDDNGSYSIMSMNQGEYTLVISATGYYTFNDSATIVKNRTTYVNTSLMINRNGEGEGTFNGFLLDATTASKISGVNYKIRSDWNNKTGEIKSSGYITGTSFAIVLPAGNYTVEFSKDGYTSNYVNIAVVSDEETNQDVILSPVGTSVGNGDTLRVVLSWGPTPSDLDSHIYGPTSYGETYHVYYSDQNYYESGNTICNLDVDDTSSYGPETTTVYELEPNGTYSFYVHDYSNRNSSYSMAMANSNAVVRVYVGNVLAATYYMPSNKDGTLWHVFDFNSDTNIITPINEFTYAHKG